MCQITNFVVVPSFEDNVKYVLLELVFYQEVSLRLPLELLDDFVVPSGGSQEGWGCGPWNSAWSSTLGGCGVWIHPGIIQQDSNHTVEKLTFNFTNMNIISGQPSDCYESPHMFTWPTCREGCQPQAWRSKFGRSRGYIGEGDFM